MAITTAFCTSAKSDMMSGLHCMNASIAFTGTSASGSPTITGVSALTGLAVGMGVNDGAVHIAANSVIASIDSATQITLSKNATGTNTGLTATGDGFNIALIKHAPAGTYGAASTNYTDVTGNSDEVSGTGYTAGGLLMTIVSPTISGTTAYVTFSPNPSWTTATIDSDGCMIYNNTPAGGTGRRGPIATRALSVHDFGGEQKVTSGTFTVVMPTAAAGTAILRIA